MGTTKLMPALALLGIAVMSGSAPAFASEHQNTVRQELFNKCDRFQGRIHGICMNSMAQQMQSYQAQASAQYKTCLDANNPRSVCDEQNDIYWQDLASAR